MIDPVLDLAPVLALDGPSGAGKGTVGTRCAEQLGWHYLDSGAIYRAVAWQAIAGEVAAGIVGADRVNLNPKPAMGSEDFAFMLQEKPGCYVFLGNDGDGPGGCGLHNPQYDFNDDILTIGADFWVRLVESEMPAT